MRLGKRKHPGETVASLSRHWQKDPTARDVLPRAAKPPVSVFVARGASFHILPRTVTGPL
jgi:hypothetical protein